MAADNLLRVIGDLVKRDGLRTKAEQEKNTDKMAEKKQKSFDDALNKILKNQSKNDTDEEEPEEDEDEAPVGDQDEPETEPEAEKEPEDEPEKEPEPEDEPEPEPEKEPEDDGDEDEKEDEFDNKPSGPDPALVAQVAAIVKQEIKDEEEGDEEKEIKLTGKREKIDTKPKLKEERLGKMSFREAVRASVTGSPLEEGYESHVLEILEDEGIKGPLGYNPFFEKGKLFVQKGSEKAAKKVLKQSGEINKIPKIVGEELEPEEYLAMESVEVDGRKKGFREALRRLTYKKFKQMKEKAKKENKEIWRKSLLGEEHTSYWMPEGLSKEGAAEFMAAASAAKRDGKKKFKFGDKEYPVTIKVDIPLKKEDVDQDSALKQIGLLDVVEKAMSSKDITKAAIKKFGKDPLYLAVFTAKSRSEAEKAHKTLMSIRGKDAVIRIADWLKKMKEEVEVDEAGVTGPTRMEVQKYFDKEKGLLRARITATEKAFKIKDLKIHAKGDVMSFKEEVEIEEAKGTDVFAVRHTAKDGKRYVIPYKSKNDADKKAKELKSDGATKIEIEKINLMGFVKFKEGYGGAISEVKWNNDMTAMKEGLEIEEIELSKEDAASFMSAASKAKQDGKKKFKIGGKEYPVTIKIKIPEEVEVDEKKGAGYDLYHKTFSGAMQHAYDVAKKKGFKVDQDEIDDKVAVGPKKPSSGKTNRYILGTDKKKKVHIQVANLDNKRYELNMYIEGVGGIEIEEKWKKGNYTVKDQDGKVLGTFKSGAKAQNYVDDLWAKGDYDSLTVELNEEVEFDESNELQAIMALGDEGIDAEINKKGQVVVKKKDLKKAEKALKGSFKKGGQPNLVGEEVELTEALGKLDKSVIDAFYYKKEKAGKVVSTDGDSLWKNGMGGQEMAIWNGRKIKITGATDSKSTESILKYMKKSIPSGILEGVQHQQSAYEKVRGIRKRLNEGLDRHAMVELKLYIENDNQLYRQQVVPIIKNVQRKMKSGKYDHTKAPKLWMYLVDNGAKKYVKEFGGDVKSQFPKDVRLSVAIEFANEYRAEIELQGGDML